MKIDHLEVANLLFEYPPEKRFRYAGGICTGRVTTVVFVYTDTGHTGVGSVYTHPGLATLIIERQLAAPLRGQDPREVESLWQRMYELTRWYGRKGAAMSAIGAIDTACWDLRGQALDKPVWKLLGAERPTCPAYASALLWKDHVSQLGEEAERHLSHGFRRMKMRLARTEEYDAEAVRAVRKVLGSDHDLVVDASMRYNVPLARRMGKVLEENRVFWFEEPFAPEDLDSYATLRGSVVTRVAAGENEFGVQGFRELIRGRCVDIVQPDASRCGGISEVVKVADLAAEARLAFAPHSWSDAIAIIANAQVVASRSNGLTVEVDQTENPFIDELLVEPLYIRDGMLSLNRRPGLGIQVNRQTLERYRLTNPLELPDGSYSDMAFGPTVLAPTPSYVEKSQP